MHFQNVESRLKVLLPDDVGAALMDGVVLCHLANHICPRSVASIHVPSPAVVSTMKCLRVMYIVYIHVLHFSLCVCVCVC